MNGVAVGVNRCGADSTIVVGDVVRFDERLGPAPDGFFEGEIRVSYFERDVADAVPMLLDVLGCGVVAMQRRTQDEIRLILLQDIGRQLAIAGLESTVSKLRESKGFAVIE